MTKLTTIHQALNVSYEPRLGLEPARCLLVLVPSVEADLTAATRRVWELASSIGAPIRFLSLCNDIKKESTLRRRLVTMSAIVNSDSVCAETEVMVGRDWVEAVRSRQQPGDMIVCFEEQHVGLSQGPLSQILQGDLSVPVYILSGLYPQNAFRSNRLTRAGAWIGFLSIILGFFLLQLNIYHLATNWTTILELLSTAVEFWLIWIWNNLFG